MAGCVRVKATITISADDRVSGEVVAAAEQRNDNDPGPQFSRDLPFGQKVTVASYNRDGFVGSRAVFADLTFAELPQLAGMNPDAAGVSLTLRRAASLVILEGRVDLTLLDNPAADVALTVNFPGEVISTNGERVGGESVQWRLKPGVVSTMTAQARSADPSTRSFYHAAKWLAFWSIAVAGLVAAIAWYGRDRSPGFSTPDDDQL